MEKIYLKEKKFTLFIKQDEIKGIVHKLAQDINRDYNKDEVLFLAILNGSFIFAADLLREITVPGQVSFVKMASYKGSTRSDQIDILIGLNERIKGKSIIIIEDIVDSGSTITKLVDDLTQHQPKNIKIVSMLFKPSVYKGTLSIDYLGKSIPNEFIIGYGLDYYGYGRNLKDIYRMV